ncbi:unnamed protein product [marine sediment metagenome]|uniref:Uncharacterized protein n=1 Tax=marine sediment metagenome TaxID=412755 RepID=X1IZT2_9ZZZZ
MEQKKKQIGNTLYLVTQTDAISALKIQTKLIKILGPGALPMIVKMQGVLGAAKKDKKKVGELAKEALSIILPAIASSFDDETVNSLVLSLFERGVFTKAGDASIPVEFSTHFVGKPMEMWKVAAFILEVNFASGENIGSDLPTTEEADLTQEN